jgi:hypothetical protein
MTTTVSAPSAPASEGTAAATSGTTTVSSAILEKGEELARGRAKEGLKKGNLTGKKCLGKKKGKKLKKKNAQSKKNDRSLLTVRQRVRLF